MKKLKLMVERMRALQREKEEMDDRYKYLNIALDQLRLKDIPEFMAENDIRTATFEGLGRVQLALDAYVSIVPDKKQEAYGWLEEHGYDGLITEYIQPSTFKAAVKDALKNGQTFPEELFNITPFTRASIVKSA